VVRLTAQDRRNFLLWEKPGILRRDARDADGQGDDHQTDGERFDVCHGITSFVFDTAFLPKRRVG
jgi:hypothetical protein